MTGFLLRAMSSVVGRLLAALLLRRRERVSPPPRPAALRTYTTGNVPTGETCPECGGPVLFSARAHLASCGCGATKRVMSP